MFEKTFLVTFHDCNGAPLGECRVAPGKAAISPRVHAPKGWRFDHWAPQVSYVLADIQTFAVYVPKEYPVTFLSETGALLKREYVRHGKDATPPPYACKRKGRPSWSGRTTNIQRAQVFRAMFEG